MLTAEEKENIFKTAYHWRYEDHLPWGFVAEMVNQDLNKNYSVAQVKKVCETYKK